MSKTDAIENAFAEAAAEFAQGRGAEISAHRSLFTNNSLIVVAHRIARKEKPKPSAATFSTPCLENKSESLVRASEIRHKPKRWSSETGSPEIDNPLGT